MGGRIVDDNYALEKRTNSMAVSFKSTMKSCLRLLSETCRVNLQIMQERCQKECTLKTRCRDRRKGEEKEIERDSVYDHSPGC